MDTTAVATKVDCWWQMGAFIALIVTEQDGANPNPKKHYLNIAVICITLEISTLTQGKLTS